jgi:hypothetical protein
MMPPATLRSQPLTIGPDGETLSTKFEAHYPQLRWSIRYTSFSRKSPLGLESHNNQLQPDFDLMFCKRLNQPDAQKKL